MTSFKDVVSACNLCDKDFIAWASANQLIPSINQQRLCNGCGGLMHVHYSNSVPDGAIWRCNNSYCSHTLSIRVDSWTSQSTLTLKTIAHLVGCWCGGRNVQTTAEDCNVSKNTVSEYFNQFRMVAEIAYRKDLSTNPLGSTGGIVEIDESHFFKAKYYKGSALMRPPIWFFGAVDCKTNRVAMEHCTSRTSEILVPMIQSLCSPGATIWSDSWNAYNELKSLGFQHSMVNHSRNYTDPITGVNTNRIEGNWNALKLFLRIRNVKNRDKLEGYVHEWCFRRNIGKTFQDCWNTIVS